MEEWLKEDPPPVPGLTFHGVVIPEICQTFWTSSISEVTGWRMGVMDAKGVDRLSEEAHQENLRVCRALKAAGVRGDFEEDWS